ncbi:hypothetical protein EYS14_21380 [Alteromonadaceae bacterium M269]|nr:hypothetical protein EYS14_21380 [Alteromonadaceae bacterium M269]
MQLLNNKEMKAAFALSAGLYAIPTIQNWPAGQSIGWEFLVGNLSWLMLFYWGPLALLLFLDSRLFLSLSWRTPVLWIIYFFTMLIGISVIGIILARLFPNFVMSAFTLTFSAFLWSTFNFTLYRAFLLYKTLQVERLERKQSQLNTLKQQLNPHFLFNSLNTVSAFVHESPQEAEEAILNLAEVLRYSLDVTAQDKVKIVEDIHVLQQYIQLEKARFSDKLQVLLNVSDDCKDKMLPPMLLQPLVENAIKHTQQWPLNISIDISLVGTDQIKLVVADNGGGLDQELQTPTKGHGLRITKERISLNQGASIRFENNNDTQGLGLKVTMVLDL